MTASSGPSDLETLLAEREWVRRVARALARDVHDADDAAQDAWVAALRAPPAAGSVRGWFRSVLASRVIDAARRAGRRAARERTAARPEAAVPSPAEIVARAQAHRAVVEAVFALDEPLRTTVVLRYFEDLGPAEIGARLGLPADTIRARLRRARDDLRRRLAPDDDSRRAAWALLLGTPRRGAAWNGGTILAGSTTKTTAAACAALLLLAGAAAFLWPRDDAARVAATKSDEAAAAAESAATAPHPDRAKPRNAAADAPDAAAPSDAAGASLSGEVRFVEGDRPAAGAEIEVFVPDGTRKVVADGLGAFRIAGLAHGVPLALSARAPGVAAARIADIRLADREPRRLGTIWLDAPVRAVVRVVDPEGAPIAGADVEAYLVRDRIERQDWDAVPPAPAAKTPSDSAGRAVFGSLGVGSWTFRAVHPDYAPSGVGPRALARGGVDVEFLVRLERGSEVSGTVTGVDGKPLVDALVVALPPVEATQLMVPRPLDPLRVEARTDAGGRYVLRALGTGEHSLGVVLPGALPARVGVVSVPSVKRFDIRLDGGRLAGRVTEEGTGRPIEGARVRAAVWRSHSPTYLTALTDADGRWSVVAPMGGILQGPARGEGEAVARPVNFDVEKDGYVFAPEAGATPWRNVWVFGAAETTYDAVMRPAASLAGVVSGPDGPVAGAEVEADVWSPLRGSLPQRTTTDSVGAYRFGGLAAGKARVTVSRDGFFQKASPGGPWRTGPAPDPASVVDVPAKGAARLDVRLERGSTLVGVVVDEAGAPVPAATVECATAGAPARTITSDVAGEFAFAGLRPAAVVKLRASCDGFADAETEASAPSGPTEESKGARLVMGRAGVVRGRVTGPGGATVKGAWVQIAPAKLALDGGYEVVGVWQTTARRPVAADGSFEAPIAWLDGAARDGVVARAGADGFAPAISARLAAPGGGVVDAGALVLEAGLRMEGRVVSSDGAGPVAGAEISFQNERLPPAFAQRRDWSTVGRASTPFEVVARTDADGRFVVDGLPAWRYELRVSVDGIERAAPVVALPQDEPATIEVGLLAPIAGRVVFEDGAPGAQLAVLAHEVPEGQGVAGWSETRADGSFEIPFLPPGAYRLEARRPSDRVLDVLPVFTGEIAGGTRDVVITAKRGGVRIAGRCVAPDGAAVPGATLFLKPAQGGTQVNARSGPDGRFEAASLSEGVWTVTATADRSVGPPTSFGRRMTVDAVEITAPARDVVLEFRPATPIAGKVVREDGGVPAGSLMVQARRGAEGKWTHFAPCRQDGSFSFPNTTAGAWQLSIVDTNTGAAVRTVGSAEFAGGSRDARLVVASTRSLGGLVTDDRGRPVAGARIEARSESGERALAMSDSEGRFQVDVPSSGKWSLVATADETGRAEAAGLEPGGPEATLALRASETVAARIVAADGAPVRGADVSLATAAGAVVARLRTDADGRFASRALAPGEYAVTVTARDGRPLDPPRAVGRVRSGAPETVLRI